MPVLSTKKPNTNCRPTPKPTSLQLTLRRSAESIQAIPTITAMPTTPIDLWTSDVLSPSCTAARGAAACWTSQNPVIELSEAPWSWAFGLSPYDVWGKNQIRSLSISSWAARDGADNHPFFYDRLGK